jgi:hypothetical protein
MGHAETIGVREHSTEEISMSSIVTQVGSMKRKELAGLVAGVLLVVASAIGPTRDVDQYITLGAKPGIASGSNVVAVQV